ncbi:MAG: hypothetical protein Q9217_005948 [Psora testacea]
MANTMTVSHETLSSMTRTTRDGRQLLYRMKVVQQPERARACGAGAKSSADRRPVDPPPIVELRILEGEGEEKKDVTFSHNANFFLYTTLEHARPMNQGRVAVSANTLPVLTGTPVAGMAYLDRPEPAGYFIFPDLSVRHEGKYRLSFNLYEELKEPERDADAGAPEGSPTTKERRLASNPTGPRNFVHFRLEVKSGPFSVFSAKKFPGLAESTTMSRLVNEQGCRVRIRRDVRMRRRDKVSDPYQDMPEDGSYPAPPDRFQTPQQAPDRPPSIGNVSVDMPTPYSTDRRPSGHEVGYYPQASYQQTAPLPLPQSATSYTSHLSFGGSSTPQYQTPTIPGPPPPPPPPPPPSSIPHYTQSSSPYTYGQPSHHHHRQMSAPHNSYSYPTQPPQQATYGPPPYVDERPYPEPRRSSGGMTMSRQQPPPLDPYVQNHPAMQQQQHHHPAHSQMRSLTPINTNPTNQCPPSLPPIQSLVSQSPFEPPTSEPKSSTSVVPQGPQNPFSASSYMSAGYHGYASNTPHSANPNHVAATHTKRPYGSTFDSSHLNQPMHGGMRPSSAHNGQDLPQIETDDGDLADEYNDLEDMKGPLVYRRADGTRQAKKCPSPRVNR